MFISKIPKYRQRWDGTIEKYDYYRLSENWRDADGKIRKRTVVNLGELTGYTKAGRKELGVLLEEMITAGSCRMSDDATVYDDAVKFYAHWRDLHPKDSSGVQPESSEKGIPQCQVGGDKAHCWGSGYGHYTHGNTER